MSENRYLVALSAFRYFGPERIGLMLKYFNNAKEVWHAKTSEFAKIGILPNKIAEFDSFRESFDIEQYFKNLEKFGIEVLTSSDSDYPENLIGLKGMPQVLYVRGKYLKSDSISVAIVGTRIMTSYGREMASRLAAEFANFGITVVSGLALGIDAEAQRSALKVGGRTLAVLASGLDIISPYSNKSLALEFIKEKGALISEYPMGHVPFKSDFALRNRLISALSKAVVVIEGRMKSGTFYTVNAAADQGRPVFAVPGPVTSSASEAPNYLIQNGAKLITCAKDVIDELDLQIKANSLNLRVLVPDGKTEADLLAALSVEPLHLDELVRILGLATGVVSARLTIMEMKGLIKNIGNNMFIKA